MTLVDKPTRVVESSGRGEFASQAKTVSEAGDSVPWLQIKKDLSSDRDVTIRQNDPVGLDDDLGPCSRGLRWAIDCSFQRDSINMMKLGDVERKRSGLKDTLN